MSLISEACFIIGRGPYVVASFSIGKFIQTLRVLINQADVVAIGLAEKTVDESVAAHEVSDGQTGALHVLERVLTRTSKSASGAKLEFANPVIDYVDAPMRALRKIRDLARGRPRAPRKFVMAELSRRERC
jgi:hypothetical protein